MNDNIVLIIKKIRNAMYLHRKGMYDYDMLVDFELDHNQWNELLTYLEQLQSNWNSLREWLKEMKLSRRYDNDVERFTAYGAVLDKMNELEGKDND